MSTCDSFKGPSRGTVEKAVNLILEAVRKAEIVEKDAPDFTGMLHPNVKGRYIHALNEKDFKFDERAMREILRNFYKQKAYSLTPTQTVDALVKGLKEAGLEYLAYEMEQECKEESDQ